MLKAVVLDGNAVSRNLLTSVLESGGYQVIGGTNATSAGIASVIKLRPQIVCIDIGQADEEGMQKLDMLRKELPKAMLFLVSGNIDSTTVQAALTRGVHGFIVKPFNAVTVLASIRNAVIKLAKQHKQTPAAGSESA